jgi:hypothetical protein
MPFTELPLYVNVDGVFAAEHMALPFGDLLGEGVITQGAPAAPLKVAQTTPTAMVVAVSPGACWIRNDAGNLAEAYWRGGCWRCARQTEAQLPIEAADGSNARIDRVIAEVLDAQFGIAGDTWRLRVVKGVPAASPSAPAEPPNAITLATVNVAAGAVAIANAAITDLRPFAMLGGRLAAAAGEIAYAQVTASITLPESASPAAVLASGSRAYDGQPVALEFSSPAIEIGATVGAQVLLFLHDGATDLGLIAQYVNPAAGIMLVPGLIRRRLTPSVGAHDYQVWGAYASTTGKVHAGAGGPGVTYNPAYLRISRV